MPEPRKPDTSPERLAAIAGAAEDAYPGIHGPFWAPMLQDALARIAELEQRLPCGHLRAEMKETEEYGPVCPQCVMGAEYEVRVTALESENAALREMATEYGVFLKLYLRRDNLPDEARKLYEERIAAAALLAAPPEDE